ncbi:MAG: HDOD domain-containing protein [bacterium]|nr:HDOD domain-containing protein [bacterium]
MIISDLAYNDLDTIKGRVLFYNVDPSIVTLLQREFLKSEIIVFDADNTSAGRKILKKEKVDMVLADYDPNANDSREFLEYVKKKFPSTNRIFLCENDFEDEVRNLVLKNIATSYFEKPHGIGAILDCLSHMLEIRQVLKTKKLMALLSVTDDLSALLRTYYEFIDAIDEDKSNKDIAGILGKDIGISARVLKIANSAFYRSGRIGSIERACIFLGLENIKNIVFTVSLSSVKKLGSEQKKHLERIIYHSLKVNQNFQRFYKLETSRPVPPGYTSIGITHDIGKIIMLQFLPDRFNKIIKYQKKNPEIGFHMAEMELGFAGSTHAEIGAYFLDLWHFPEASIYTALFHHNPEETFDSYRELLDIFSFVNEFAR